jgi:quercetin dioxygenase-like cupin family protein
VLVSTGARPQASRRVDGQEPTTLEVGEVFFVPAESVHAVRNLGGGNAAELATYVVERGKPLAVPGE